MLDLYPLPQIVFGIVGLACGIAVSAAAGVASVWVDVPLWLVWGPPIAGVCAAQVWRMATIRTRYGRHS